MSQKSRFTAKLNAALQSIDSAVKSTGQVVSAQTAMGTYSQEGAQHFEANQEHELSGLRHDISEVLKQDLDGEFSLEDSEASLEAGMIIAAAVNGGENSIGKYHEAALSRSAGDAMSLESISSGIGGDIPLALDNYSQESFDTNELANYAAQSIAFNVLAARQDEFAEGFFPTKVLTPAEGGITITVDRQEVIDYAMHKTDGSDLNQSRRNLIDAFQDHEILNRPATEVVPFNKPDDSTDKFFATEVSATDRKVGEHNVRTRPLKIGQKVNLLSLSSHPGLIDNGVLDITDQLAAGMRLSALYVHLTDTAGADPTNEVLKLNVSHMTRNQFRKSAEGSAREVTLNSPGTAIPLDSKTQTTAGADSALLQATVADQGLVAQLRISVSGHANLDTGELEVMANGVIVESAYKDGEEVSLDSGAGKALVDRMEELSAKVIGYDLLARRSNTNWRSTGAIIDVTPYQEKYAVEPGYPISVLSNTQDNAPGSKISGMVNAARIRNSNNAVTALLNYSEQLAAHADAIANGVKTDIIGAGRHIVKPYFNEDNINVLERIESISSFERADDVSCVLVDEIRDTAFRMLYESNYAPALNLSNAGTKTKPHVIIGCDPVVARYLNIKGDERLLGGEMDFTIVSTQDRRMRNKIAMSFTRQRPGSEDGLTFGVHAYIPEMVQRVNVSRNGSTVQNDRVIPRSIHVPVLPVMSMLEVVNLEEAVANTGTAG